MSDFDAVIGLIQPGKAKVLKQLLSAGANTLNHPNKQSLQQLPTDGAEIEALFMKGHPLLQFVISRFSNELASIEQSLGELNSRLSSVEAWVGGSKPDSVGKNADRFVVDETAGVITVDGKPFSLKTSKQLDVLKVLHKYSPGWVGPFVFRDREGFDGRHDRIIQHILKDHPDLRNYIEGCQSGFRLIFPENRKRPSVIVNEKADSRIGAVQQPSQRNT